MTCVTYQSAPYEGRGPSQTCRSILAAFPSSGLRTLLVVVRTRVPIPVGVECREALPWPSRRLPWGFVRRCPAAGVLARAFRRALRDVGGGPKVAYFWPDAPIELIRLARTEGFVTVREMINVHRGSAKRLLDAEYRRLGLPPQHGISAASVVEEREELAHYDYVLASNRLVEASLEEAGVPAHRVIATSFGWSPDRFPATPNRQSAAPGTGLNALFVGTVCVGKGVHVLLDAWQKSRLPGTLTLAGDLEPELARRVEAAVASGGVRHLPYVADVNTLYRSADFFVFPTLQEGGPQVTYEAAGCGLPVVTTAAGAGRLVVDGVNGYLVDPVAVDPLVVAMTRLAEDPALRARLGARAAQDALPFDYRVLGRHRAEALRRVAVEGWRGEDAEYRGLQGTRATGAARLPAAPRG